MPDYIDPAVGIPAAVILWTIVIITMVRSYRKGTHR